MDKKKFESILGYEKPENLIDPKALIEEADWKRKSSDIASRILDYLDESKSLTQRGLAKKVGLSAQRVSKILSGGQNLTLSTIGKIERALNIELIHVPGFEDYNEWERSLQFEEVETELLPEDFFEKTEKPIPPTQHDLRQNSIFSESELDLDKSANKETDFEYDSSEDNTPLAA